MWRHLTCSFYFGNISLDRMSWADSVSRSCYRKRFHLGLPMSLEAVALTEAHPPCETEVMPLEARFTELGPFHLCALPWVTVTSTQAFFQSL